MKQHKFVNNTTLVLQCISSLRLMHWSPSLFTNLCCLIDVKPCGLGSPEIQQARALERAIPQKLRSSSDGNFMHELALGSLKAQYSRSGGVISVQRRGALLIRGSLYTRCTPSGQYACMYTYIQIYIHVCVCVREYAYIQFGSPAYPSRVNSSSGLAHFQNELSNRARARSFGHRVELE